MNPVATIGDALVTPFLSRKGIAAWRVRHLKRPGVAAHPPGAVTLGELMEEARQLRAAGALDGNRGVPPG